MYSSDIDAMKALWLRCFEDDPRFVNLFYSAFNKPINYRLIKEEGQVVAMLHHLEGYSLPYCSEMMKGAYYYALATEPSHRKRGLMGQLIIETMQDMRSLKKEFCVTIPANRDLFNYYSRFGFIPAFKRIRERWNKEAPIPAGAKLLKKVSDRAIIQYALANRYAVLPPQELRLDMTASQVAMRDICNNGGYIALLNRGEQGDNEVQAIVEHQGQSLLIRHYLSANNQELDLLFTLIKQSSDLPLYIEHRTLQTDDDPGYFGMIRLLNAYRYLQAYGVEHPFDEMSFYLIDNQIPLNTGLYQIKRGELFFKSNASPITGETSCPIITIQTLTKWICSNQNLYMGLMMD